MVTDTTSSMAVCLSHDTKGPSIYLHNFHHRLFSLLPIFSAVPQNFVMHMQEVAYLAFAAPQQGRFFCIHYANILI